MLILLTGRTGSGKSYQAISLILDSINNDRKVFTNILMSVQNKNYVYRNELAIRDFLAYIDETFTDVASLPDKEEEMRQTDYYNADFFLDEAHLLGFKKKIDSIQNWMTIHRHFNQNIYIITQIKQNIHRDYHFMFHEHIDMIPQNKRLSKGSIGYRRYDSVGGERLETKYFTPNSQIFELYHSGAVETGQNKDVIKLALYLAGLAVLLYFLYGSFSKILGLSGEEEEKKTTKTNTVAKIKHKSTTVEDGVYLKLKCVLNTCSSSRYPKITTNKQDLEYLIKDTSSKYLREKVSTPYLTVVYISASPLFLKTFGVKNEKKKDISTNSISTNSIL